MRDVFIVEPVRTPVGRYGGALASVRPDDMAALVLQSTVERSGIPPAEVDDVILGCANQAGEDNRNIARMAALLAGLPQSVPGVTVNRLCSSSLEAVIQAARAIRSGEADILLAGGVESMSRAPYALPKNASGKTLFGNLTAFDTALGWRFPNPKMKAMFPLEAMGETAENVAERWQIARDAQDRFALDSHRKALRAQEAGHFDDEIIPVTIPRRKGEPVIVARDEQPRADSTLEKLASLRPAFRKNGSVTAGNASSLNDGAVAMVVASEEAVQRYNLKPLARYLSSGVAGVDPRTMGIGPVPATRSALGRAGISIAELGRFELNEAFAAQSLACIRDLEIDPSIVNVYGGAIAIGHPLGMSGGRLVATLLRGMQRDDVRYGAAALCVGVGQGLAAAFEKA